MKSLKTILLLFCCSSVFIANAQISIGVKGGYTKAWEFYNRDLPETAEISVNTFNFSALLYKPLSKRLQIGIEPGYAKRGAACVPGWGPVFVADTRLFLNYVDLPVMVSGGIPFWKKRFEVFGKAGYGISRLVSAFEQSTLTDWENPGPRQPLPLKDSETLNRIDHGAHGAAGLSMKLGPGKIMLETDWYMGFRDADKGTTSKNRTASINFGYMISL